MWLELPEKPLKHSLSNAFALAIGPLLRPFPPYLPRFYPIKILIAIGYIRDNLVPPLLTEMIEKSNLIKGGNHG